MNDALIKLAEAMGWHFAPVEQDNVSEHVQRRKSFLWQHTDHERKRFANELPDPFTDANDDYAVLEWMRSLPDDVNWEVYLMFPDPDECRDGYDYYMTNYQIGDYARAALLYVEDQDRG